jgi:hypothetical protein
MQQRRGAIVQLKMDDGTLRLGPIRHPHAVRGKGSDTPSPGDALSILFGGTDGDATVDIK